MNPILEFFISDDGQLERIEKVKTLVKLLKRPLKEKLPILAHKFIILPDGRRANFGDILRRPIIMNFSYGDCDHYCFVYGTNEYGESIIIEMNKENSVTPNTVTGFLKHHPIDSVDIIPKPKGTHFKSILARAEKWSSEGYEYYTKNCQQFAYYCVFGKEFSPGIDKLNKTVLPLSKFFIACLQNSKANVADVDYTLFIDDQLNKLRRLTSRLETNIQRDAVLSQYFPKSD